VRRGWAAALAAIVVVVATGVVVESIRNNSADHRAPHAPQRVQSLPKLDLEVFMNVGASKSQIRGVNNGLTASTHVRRFAFVSQTRAYREFKRLFKDQPDIIASTSPDVLPASFRVEVLRGTDPNKVARALKHLPGVDEVKVQVRFPAKDFQREIQRLCRTNRASLPPNAAKTCR
jgi:cell division protein FtsX